MLITGIRGRQAKIRVGRCSMNYELTEECYELLLDDYNNGSNLYYQLFGLDGISGKDISMPL